MTPRTRERPSDTPPLPSELVNEYRGKVDTRDVEKALLSVN